MKREMKTLKFKITAIAFCLCMAAFTSKTMAQEIIGEGKCGENLTWVLTDDGTLTISGNGEMYNYVNSDSPTWYPYKSSITSVIIEDGVTTVGRYAFGGYSDLKSVTFSNSVTYIMLGAFIRTGLTSELILPTSLKKIEGEAFYEYSGLTGKLILPESLTMIEDYAFYNCGFTGELTIPESVYLGARAFADCKGFTSLIYNAMGRGKSSSLIFSDYEKNNGSEVNDSTLLRYPATFYSPFCGCSNMSQITVGRNVKYIPDFTFFGTGATVLNYNAENCLEMGAPDFPTVSSGIKQINIGNEVKSIPSCAFYECAGLTSITIPESITDIGILAFAGCYSLTVINYNAINCNGFGYFDPAGGGYAWANIFPKLEEINIGSKAGYPSDFRYFTMSSLTSINAHPDNAAYSSENGILYDKAKTTLIQYPAGKPETEYIIPDFVTKVGGLAFHACSKLASVIIGDNIKSIEYGVFHSCSELTSVSIGNYVQSIGDEAFRYCSNLNTIICKATIPPSLGSWSFNFPNSAQVFVPCGTKPSYLTTSYWSVYFSNFIEEGEVDVPVNVVVMSSEDSFTITWEGDSELYEVYRNNDLIATCSDTNYTDTDLINGTEYCYQIKSGDCGSLTDEVCKTYNIVSISELQTGNGKLRIYPNPAKEQLTVESGELRVENKNYTVYNSEGQIVMQGVLRGNVINVKSLSSGIYYLNFAGAKVKFVKE